jgi:hypothetical protein
VYRPGRTQVVDDRASWAIDADEAHHTDIALVAG